MLCDGVRYRGFVSGRSQKDRKSEKEWGEITMKTLQTIQRIFGIFQVLTKIAEILCIVGAAFCAVAALCAVTWNNGGQVFGIMGEPIEIFTEENFLQTYVKLLAMTFVLTSDAILLGLAHSYLKSEQADGTPFTEQGAERLKRLGIRCIYIPIIAIAVSGAIAAWQGVTEIGDISNASGVVTGIVLILASFIFRYGAELEKTREQ